MSKNKSLKEKFLEKRRKKINEAIVKPKPMNSSLTAYESYLSELNQLFEKLQTQVVGVFEGTKTGTVLKAQIAKARSKLDHKLNKKKGAWEIASWISNVTRIWLPAGIFMLLSGVNAGTVMQPTDLVTGESNFGLFLEQIFLNEWAFFAIGWVGGTKVVENQNPTIKAFNNITSVHKALSDLKYEIYNKMSSKFFDENPDALGLNLGEMFKKYEEWEPKSGEKDPITNGEKTIKALISYVRNIKIENLRKDIYKIPFKRIQDFAGEEGIPTTIAAIKRAWESLGSKLQADIEKRAEEIEIPTRKPETKNEIFVNILSSLSGGRVKSLSDDEKDYFYKKNKITDYKKFEEFVLELDREDLIRVPGS
jgi:hypothetical protein